MKTFLTVLVALGAVCAFGCESKPEQPKPDPTKAAATAEAAQPAKAEPAKPAAAETAKPASTGGW
ncbi:hypothetical protein SOCEGT47_047560 [Sorangium cellulosum]|uniref:Secreted protein n=1 Tax=Sorangium cellulosum TaxID=56 RepID=A0A4P2Q4F1_SORCE|nr:hypothetical protein [Sorangium cellulosum]AUX24219.1 hypothetical protein SOCEGT47_047560 [Sorangium cellulosum]